MNKRKIAISLPKPCDENWDNMTPADKGRHCAQCRKTVVDFTLLSDGQIIDIFKKAKDNPPCGHFLETQLDRELVDARYKPSFISTVAKRIAATVILFQSVAVAAIAQQVKKVATAQHTDKKKPGTNNSKRQICGHVLRDETNEPLAGVKVQIRGTQIDSVTDRNGMFILTLPDSFNRAQFVLEGTLAGTTSEMAIEQTVNLADVEHNKELTLYVYKVVTLQQHEISTYNVREIKTFGGVPVQMQMDLPSPRQNIWKRITKPFRGKKHS